MDEPQRGSTERIKGGGTFEQDHVHFDNGAALNKDGTWKQWFREFNVRAKRLATNHMDGLYRLQSLEVLPMRWRPTQGPHVPKISLVEWLRVAFRRPEQITDDVHFDQLATNWNDVRTGEEWVPHARAAFQEVKRMASGCANLRGVQEAVVVLPLGESKNIRLWKPDYWATAGTRIEPPSLILTKARFDERYDEEYYRRLDDFDGADGDLTATFRSQRRLDGTGEDDAFDNAIYLTATLSVSCAG